MGTTSGDEAGTTAKVMRLRYAGTCERCGASLDAGTRAAYLRATRSVRCLGCLDERAEPAGTEASADPEPVDAGRAGSSARREYERRSAQRETRIREAHPRLGGLILALSEEPQSTTAWARGARGEELLGARLDQLTAQGLRLLHDRRIPGTRANIDHIVVGPAGVHVIDAKRYRGRPALRTEGGLFRPRLEKLVVGSRDCTRLVDSMHKQVELVRTALAALPHPEVPVHGALCFVDAEWPLLGGAFLVGDVAVLSPKKLTARLGVDGPLVADEVDAIHRTLAKSFPAA